MQTGENRHFELSGPAERWGLRPLQCIPKQTGEQLHTQLADEAVCIGPAAAKDSYLNMEQIISATIVSGADAIHPGYGFLSENSRFAELCEACNITFIGPDSKTIAKLGNKAEARTTMIRAGVPVIPGCEEPLTDDKRALEIARKIGFPVIIKAVLGGGGKGMRVAYSRRRIFHRIPIKLRRSGFHVWRQPYVPGTFCGESPSY